VALFSWKDSWAAALERVSAQGALTRGLGAGGYQLLGVICFAIMGALLFKVARRPQA
jgi:hypothetical protein